MLSRPASQITIGEIVAVLETGPELVDCQRSPEICPRSKTCITRNVWEQASEAMYNVLYGITLDQLASSARECPEGGTHRTDLNATAAI
jgi:DNA-binding IscR family transcriptional regulator